MLNYEFPPIGGGAAKANLCLLRQYAGRDDLHVDMLTSAPKPGIVREKFSENITIHKVGIHKKNLHFWRRTEVIEWLVKAGLHYRRLLRENDYDLVKELVDNEGLTNEAATERATYQDISITQEGILAGYKVAKEITEFYELEYDEKDNFKGKKLSEADLIRNYIFMQLPIDEQETFNTSVWRNFEDMFFGPPTSRQQQVIQT